MEGANAFQSVEDMREEGANTFWVSPQSELEVDMTSEREERKVKIPSNSTERQQ